MASGFPGNLVEAYLAGIMPATCSCLNPFMRLIYEKWISHCFKKILNSQDYYF
jgi:hypothetical protein